MRYISTYIIADDIMAENKKDKGKKSKKKRTTLSSEMMAEVLKRHQNGESQTNIAKSLNVSRLTIFRYLNSLESKKMEKEIHTEEVVKQDEAQQIEKKNDDQKLRAELLQKLALGKLSYPEFIVLQNLLSKDSIQGKAMAITEQTLAEQLGKGYADVIMKGFLDDAETINRLRNLRGFYEPFGQKYGYSFIGLIEYSLRYVVEEARRQEELANRKDQEENNETDFWNKVFMIKILDKI